MVVGAWSMAGATRQLFGYYYSIDTKACQSIHVQAKQVLLQKQVSCGCMHDMNRHSCLMDVEHLVRKDIHACIHCFQVYQYVLIVYTCAEKMVTRYKYKSTH